VDTLTTTSRPDSGVSVSASPMNQTEFGAVTETEVISIQHLTRVRTSSSGSSEGAIPKVVAKKRRPKRAKKSETRALPIAIHDSKLLLQQELDLELNDLFNKLASLERMTEDQESALDELVRNTFFIIC
jgi:hypothetical protein